MYSYCIFFFVIKHGKEEEKKKKKRFSSSPIYQYHHLSLPSLTLPLPLWHANATPPLSRAAPVS